MFPMRTFRVRDRAAKRAVDLGGALLLLLILWPIFLGIVLLFLVLEGAPTIHRRRVVGRQGEFDAFKFRSMRRDADDVLRQDDKLREAFSRSYKLKDDPRVTRFGSTLRRYSLDELPQLWNVVRGEMSLVGPRMITAPELQKYGCYQDLLLSVKPGITGYWQVHGRQDVSYEERVKMDVDYILGWRITLDLKILLLTPLRMMGGQGAY